MRITGQMAELSLRESRLLGCEQTEFVTRLNFDRALGDLVLRQVDQANRTPVGGHLAVVGVIEAYMHQQDEDIVLEAAGAVLVHETGGWLDGLQLEATIFANDIEGWLRDRSAP